MNKKVIWIVVVLFLLLVLPGAVLGGGRVDGLASAEFLGEAASDLARSVALVGDVNGDGYGDLLIGAEGNDAAGSNAGAAYLVLGGSGTPGWGLRRSLAAAIRYTGEAAGDNAGFTVAGAGDVNGDGLADFLVGAKWNDDAGADAGAAYLVLGSASPAGSSLGAAGILEYTGEQAGNTAGFSLAGAGDVNSDGFADFVVGAINYGPSTPNQGTAYLVLGSASPTGGSLGAAGIQKYTGEAPDNYAGFSTAGAGDVNGDGFADFLVGAHLNDDGGSDAGAAYLVLGSASPAGGSLGAVDILEYTGEAANDSAGSSVAGAGDVNGDGFADFLVGAYFNDDGGANAGAAYLVLGRPVPVGSSLGAAGILEYSGEAADDRAGSSVAGAGDVNGDGFADFLAGAPQNDDGGSSAGAAYLLLGSAAPAGGSLSAATQYTGKAAGSFLGDQYGLAAGTAGGDVNDDGLGDLFLAGRNNVDGIVGAAYLILSEARSADMPSVRERQNLSGSGDARPVAFEQAGVRVDYTAGALASGDVSVTRYLFHPCSTDKRLQTPIWTIESSKFTAGATVDLLFRYTDAAVEGMTESNLKLWTRPAGRPCGAWTMVASGVDASHNFISAGGLTSLGQFTISEAEPSPTAVQERSLAVRLAQEPLELVIILALLVLSAGATYWRLRQHGLLPAAEPEREMMAQLRQLAADQEEALAHLRRLAPHE